MKHLLPVIGLCFSLTAGAVELDVKMPSDTIYNDMVVLVKPMGNPSRESAVQLTITPDGNRTGSVIDDPAGLYTIYLANSQAQYSMPLYVAPGTETVAFGMSVKNHKPSTTLSDIDNSVLRQYTAIITDKAMELNKGLGKMSADEMRALVTSYMTEADSLALTPGLTDDIAKYMRMWGYISASDAIEMERFMSGRAHRTPIVKAEDVLPPAQQMLDNSIVLYFPTSVQAIVSSVKGDTMEQSLENLYSTYATPGVRSRVADVIVSSFLDSYNYGNGFDAGLERLEAVTAKYSLPAKYVNVYNARKATIPGAAFPNVKLVDREGKEIDFSSFRGKYVYVDLWASWCGPCVKEVPHLQKLEREFKDSDVVFVSISIDSTRQPWLKKMSQLDMHGNQLWNSDENLPRMLNVKGIPHFLIYDREGKLHTYNAPRPSNPQLPELLRSLK